MKRLSLILLCGVMVAGFCSCEENGLDVTNKHNGHEYVDLGLPSGTLWATCNVGADSPEEYGDYFAWGDTITKSSYYWSTYEYASSDAATANWGGDWRMPTLAEQKELLIECTWTWTTHGVQGFEVKGTNGNSIFLPAAGYYNSSNLYDRGWRGYYWSSSLDDQNDAYGLEFFGSGYSECDDNKRCYGYSVRPVYTP